MTKVKGKKILNTSAFYLLIGIIVVIILFPFFYSIMVSFMTKTDIETFPIKIFPSKFVLENYRNAISYQPIFTYILNSFIISIIAILVNIIVAFMVSYAIEKTNIKFKSLIMFLVLAMTLLPTITIIQPIYNFFQSLGLLNGYLGVALLISVMDLPLSIWFLTTLFRQVPDDLEESATMDGANLFVILKDIYFPVLKHGIFSLAILVFINAWNQFMIPQILNQKATHRTAIVALTIYQNDFDVNFGTVSAASVLTMLPILLLIFVFQKRIISNVLEGGVKG